MGELPFKENEMDLIWSEGAIYNIGFEYGLNLWNKYLKPGGYLAVSEVSWFTESRPAEIEDFWMDAYPEIDTVPNKVSQMQKAGYVPVAHFILPVNCWTEHFHDLMPPVHKTFLERYDHSKAAVDFVENQEHEIKLYDKYKDYYGYVFYIGQKFEAVSNNSDKPDFSIRPETPNDYDEIYNLIRTAFKTANVMDGDEQDYAVGLRESKKYIPELALVAESQGKLIGHIMFTRFVVQQPDNTTFNALLVAPLSVLLEHRDKGIGSSLMNKGLMLATEMGYKAAFLAGDPDYYSRFGFVPSSDYGILNINGIPNQFIMVKELVPGSLDGISGEIDLH